MQRNKIVALLAFAMLAAAGNVYAMDVQVGVPSGITGFTPSNSVNVGYESDTTGTVYSISSKHTQGNKCYASTSASTKMYMATCDAGSSLATDDNPTLPGSPSDSTMTGGAGAWTSM